MKRILIANRGEIAVRILRACREMGYETVAAFSQVDTNALHLRWADDSVCISKHSYLDAESFISAALSRGCDAVHPGYGFLSENSSFARAVIKEGLNFIGPDPDDIEIMGDKARARDLMDGSGIPVLPGTSPVKDLEEAERLALSIGYPIMLKAAHGGGGRGITVVTSAGMLKSVFDSKQSESEILFGSPELYIEKYLENARHIEIQVFGDGRGKVLHFGARDCSVQRRNQKLIEESPPPGLDSAIIAQLGELCCRALAITKYKSAGTLEFLYHNGEFFFIEMNTRIQVEHPVTEYVTGIDLLKLQLILADSGELELDQRDINFVGHAIECRVNAENEHYEPSPGFIEEFQPPGGPGVRVDSHLYTGYRVSHYYDSLIAKVICHGQSRSEAVQRMMGGLREFEIRGVTTNLPLLMRVIANENFVAGDYNTSLLKRAGVN